MNDCELIWEKYESILDINDLFTQIDRAVSETEGEIEKLNKESQPNVRFIEDEYEDDDGELVKRWELEFDNHNKIDYYDSIEEHDGVFSIDSENHYHKYNYLEDAKKSVEDNLLRKLTEYGVGTFGVVVQNNRECYRIFDVFPKELNGYVFKNGWFLTKWGSWYIEGENEDVDRLKISVRDHEEKSMNHQTPNKSCYVSKNWEPKEVGDCLKKIVNWINQQ